ncbi:sugar kinase [Frondihabitans sucicola]|uniref:Sugar kinase n=1 Tax=Frondihabitans sucicola TaxID=1268041 RepID=A0ABN6XUN5_9MICO|nr:ROK family transcriptional regulator [Frondihabitans sucicola]BDZ48531.1 sugar kinase [Frondihabitans sucicola]
MSMKEATVDPVDRTLPSPGAVEGSGFLLQLLRQTAGQTISELAAAMGVSRSTVVQRLDFLHERGLVSNGTSGSGSRGRPAAVSRFDPAGGIVLAVQIGMTGCRFAVTDLSGEVLADRLVSIDIPAGPERVLADLEKNFVEIVRETGRELAEIAGIGVGIPSAIELLTYSRSLGQAGTDWDREWFASNLRERFHSPVFIDLDVNLLALAERQKAWPHEEVFVCIKLGTLIDAAIVVNGAPIHGVSKLAGELGHIKVGGSTVPCTCGGVGCLDAVASGNALVKQLAREGSTVTHVSDVVALVAQGDPQAVRAVREAGRHIGEALASVVNLLNPSVIAAWGYLTGAETALFAGIREGLYQNALPGSSERLRLVSTALGDLAGVQGAASMVIDEVLEPAAVDRMIVQGSW